MIFAEKKCHSKSMEWHFMTGVGYGSDAKHGGRCDAENKADRTGYP